MGSLGHKLGKTMRGIFSWAAWFKPHRKTWDFRLNIGTWFADVCRFREISLVAWYRRVACSGGRDSSVPRIRALAPRLICFRLVSDLRTIFKWLWINTYRYSLLGDEHPFATYFDVHQGYMVLTHSHISVVHYCEWWFFMGIESISYSLMGIQWWYFLCTH